MEDMIQTQKVVTQSISRLDAIMSELVNDYRNEKTLSYQPLFNPDISNSIDLTQKSWCFENHFNLTKIKILENHIDILASYPFLEIELEHECDPEA